MRTRRKEASRALRDISRMSTIPQKKSGRLIPARAIPEPAVSCHRSRYTALTTPSGIAVARAMRSESTTIMALAVTFWPMRVAIGSL